MFGYYKKLLNDMEALRKRTNPEGSVVDAMRHLAETGEYPKNRRLRGQVKRMLLTAMQMFETVPPCPAPEPEPPGETSEIPLAETFEEYADWVVAGGNVTAIRRFS
jgi:hypothetical protein